MKNIRTILILTLGIFVFNACESDLNVLPQDKISKDDFLSNGRYASEVVNSAYIKC